MTIATPPDLIGARASSGGGGGTPPAPEVIDVTQSGLPAASAAARGKLYENHEIPAAWFLHEVPQSVSSPQGEWFEYASDQAVAYTASTRDRNYGFDIDLGFGSNRRVVATAQIIWIIDGSHARAYNVTDRRRNAARDINLGSGSWTAALTDGTTVWFVNNTTNMAVGYQASNSNRGAGFDISLGTGNWVAAVSDGTTLWFVNGDEAVAYLASNRQRQSSDDIDLLANGDWTGAATDETTIWFVDDTTNIARAYRVSNGNRHAANDINLGSGNWTGAACDETTVWFIRDEPQGNYIGEFATDAAATTAGWTTEGQWYYNTGDRVGYRLDRISGTLRRQAHAMTTLLGASHVWLGHGRNTDDLLERIAAFAMTTVYIGEVGNRLVQLYNESYVAGSDGHTIFDWALAFGLGTPMGLPTALVGHLGMQFTIDEGDWYNTGIVMPQAADAEWVIIHINNGEWHFNRVSDYANITRGTPGGSVDDDEIWDQFLELAQGFARWIQLGISANNELLVSSPVHSAEAPIVTTVEVRSLPLSHG